VARPELWCNFRGRRGGETAINDGRNNGVTVVIGAVQWSSPCDCDKRPGDRPPAPRRSHRINNTSARPPPSSTLSGRPNSAAVAAAVAATVLSITGCQGGGVAAACDRENRTLARNTLSLLTRESEMARH